MSADHGENREGRAWHPIEDIRGRAENMGRASGDFPGASRGGRALPADRAPEQPLTLAENSKGYEVRVELPDVEKRNLRVNVGENAVTILARWVKERKFKDRDGAQRVESAEQHYRRAVQLPATTVPTQAKATFRDRVLKIFLPRAKPSRVRRIDVK